MQLEITKERITLILEAFRLAKEYPDLYFHCYDVPPSDGDFIFKQLLDPMQEELEAMLNPTPAQESQPPETKQHHTP